MGYYCGPATAAAAAKLNLTLCSGRNDDCLHFCASKMTEADPCTRGVITHMRKQSDLVEVVVEMLLGPPKWLWGWVLDQIPVRTRCPARGYYTHGPPPSDTGEGYGAQKQAW